MVVSEKNSITNDIVLKAKEGDTKSQEFILVCFTPLILSLVKRYNIPGFAFDDLVQHCNLTLLRAISLFNSSSYFPSYAKMALVNNLRYLCRGNVKHDCDSLNASVPNSDVTFLDVLEDQSLSVEDEIIRDASLNSLMSALEYLEHDEKHLILFLLDSDNGSLMTYSRKFNIPYSRCKYTKRKAFLKLRNILKNLI